MELIAQQHGPELFKLLLRISISACLLGKQSVKLQILTCKLCTAVEFFVSCHRGISAAVILQIQLSDPARKLLFSLYVGIECLEEVARS